MLLSSGTPLTIDLITILIGLVLIVYLYYKYAFTYWQKKGLYNPTPSIPFGNISSLITKKAQIGELYKNLYDELKAKGLKHGGLYSFSFPTYVPADLDIIKCILQNDFNHFVNHGSYSNAKTDPLSAHLFALEDKKWKQTRVKLTPTFTSGKVKMMFHSLTNCTNGLRRVLEEAAEVKSGTDIKELYGRFTTDAISSCAFGIESNSLKNPNSDIYIHNKAFFSTDMVQNIKNFLSLTFPRKVLDNCNFYITPKKVTSFFMKTVEDIVTYREKNNVSRNDFLHLLLQLKNRGTVSDDDQIKDDGKTNFFMSLPEIAAQCFVFFAAGYETSSTTSTFASYEIAKNQQVQERVRNEIRKVLGKYQNRMTYDAITEMHYLHQVVCEALRKYPPLPILPRICNKKYTVPGTSVVIEEGTQVFIPVLGVHRDPEIYPQPEVFDPERFNDENKKSRHPFAWLPFGEGPRLCIGLRFGLLQTKLALITSLSNFRITVNSKTIVPLEIDKAGVLITPKGGLWLDLEKLPRDEVIDFISATE